MSTYGVAVRPQQDEVDFHRVFLTNSEESAYLVRDAVASALSYFGIIHEASVLEYIGPNRKDQCELG